MGAPMSEDLAYQYYGILRDVSGEDHGLGNDIISINLNEINENVVELTNDPSSSESFDVVNDLGRYDIDEHYDAIEPTLLNFNHDIEGCHDSQQIDETETSLMEAYSDDSNTTNSDKIKSSTFEYDSESSYHSTAHSQSHINSKLYKCLSEGCGKIFSTSANLKTHVKIHTVQKPHVCNYCSKVFKTLSEKGKHLQIHTDVKPFPCTIEGCDRSFATRNARKVHVRSHTGDRPYACTHPGCGKAFASSANQKSHQRIHSGEKPYACSFEGCGKRFTEYSTMYKHKAKHRNVKSDDLTREQLQYISDNSTDQYGNS